MTTDPDFETERRVRAALADRAERTTVSPDALDRIRTRSGSRSLTTRPLLYAAAAVIVFVLVGVAVLTRPDENAGPSETADTPTTLPEPPATTEPPPSTEPTSTTEPQPTLTIPPAGPVSASSLTHPLDDDPVEVARAGLQLFPTPEMSSVRTTAEDAARGWAIAELGIEEPDLEPAALAFARAGEVADDTAAFDLYSPNESGGRGRIATKIVTATADFGSTWVVTHVVSDAFRIGLVEWNDTERTGVRVTGAGRAFEGTATMFVGDLAESVFPTVGAGGFDDFSVIVPEPGEGPLRVTIIGATVFADEIPDISSFRAIPTAPQSDIVVFDVESDDVLNLRAGPGVDREIIGTIPPDGAGIVHSGLTSMVGTEEWWQIVHDEQLGWVNRRFLSVQLADHEATRLDDRLVETTMGAVGDLLGGTADAGPFAPRVEIGGIGVYADFPTPWRTVDREDLDGGVINWNPEGIDDRGCDCDLTTPEFLGFDTAKWDLAEYTAGLDISPDEPNFFWATGQFPDFYERFTTVTVHIPEPNPDVSLDWRRYTFVWEFEDGTPQIRGIWRWGWTP